jgi:hypothetical protein
MKKSESERSIQRTTNQLTAADHWDHFLARIGFRRGSHRVNPGLYELGSPDSGSPVFVSSNYTLSFDSLRSSIKGISAYILVLDTQGINVWCAAGKGTFGTNEIVRQVEETNLKDVVATRKLILPQLGAPGVAAHEVKKRTGFLVEYGPVRTSDIPEYLKSHQATKEMRVVHFSLPDRLVLIPVEITRLILPLLIAIPVFFFIGGLKFALALLATIFTGVVLLPILLPWIPTPNFSTKGFILGGLAAVPFAISSFVSHPLWIWYRQLGQALGFLMIMPAVTAFIALNFTGSTTYTSRSGVKREIFKYIPLMAWTFGLGIILSLLSGIVH